MSTTKPVPDGASGVMLMLVCSDAGAELDFITTTFDAVERVRRPGSDGAVAHALETIGGAMVMIEGEWPTLDSRARRSTVAPQS
jgi:PhnB protein